MSDVQTNLADQALDNLVNQFARPLDFLRELVQNSIDAGSPRVEVRLDFEPPKPGQELGVLCISVDDWGDGMDEAIIDNQLTRLFSSQKEGDLTKIGKFGIGFTSIFAIRPELVQLHTGRHGENWELLFHADRSYNKERLNQPVDGTKIKLFKRMARDEVDRFVEEARFILTYWCEHSDVPVTFWDRTQGVTVEVADSDDPFAAFGDASLDPTIASGPEQVNRPLDSLEAELSVTLRRDDVEVVVGVAEQPLFGYYNAGLTLLRTQNLDALGGFQDALRHLSFKVKCDALEHTLTRDNVLQDLQWERAMRAVLEARKALIERLIERLGQAVQAGEAPERWQRYLSRCCDQADVAGWVRAKDDRPLFRSALGEPVTLAQVTGQRSALNAVLVWDGDEALARGIVSAGHLVLWDTPEARELIEVTSDAGMFGFGGGGGVPIERADAVFVLPDPVALETLDEAERRLVNHTTELLTRACGSRLRSVRVGDFGGPETGATEALVLDGATEDGVYQRRRSSVFGWLIERLPSILRFRHMLINRHHPLYRAQLLASTEDPWLAAAGLASALLHVEEIEPDRIHRLMLHLAHARLERTE